ncbi:MAG: 50S ribosomal protein L29 [Deltaproteobacteria bacterium]|nr:50S ribosomal protein L29 [Deltaproteobacteria bacterium]
MNSKEIRAMTMDDLKAKGNDLLKELFNLRMQGAMGQIDNPMRIRSAKRDIARIKTIMNEKTRGKVAQ